MSNLDALFPGFKAHWIDAPAGRIFARVGGSGEPVVLLHGFPQTHAMWHRIAPELARRFTVICLDLRGYSWSSAPASHHGEAYSKRAMGEDVVAAMSHLGHQRFAVVGHDRGARVGYRLALDHPGRVTKLALLDILPTVHVWREMKAGRVPATHWGTLSQPEPGPETAIKADPTAYFEGLMAKWTKAGDMTAFVPAARQSYRESFSDPARIHALCEDYRAGATLDLAHDEADLAAGRKILCPTLLVWGDFYLTGQGADPVAIWGATFAPEATGAKVKGGHFVAEEDAGGTLVALDRFLG